jgi:hypothetical protein
MFTKLAKDVDAPLNWEDELEADKAAKVMRDAKTEATVTRPMGKTVGGKVYLDLDLYETTDYVRRSCGMVLAAPSIAWLMRARCRAFRLGHQEAAAGNVSAQFRTHCCACGKAVPGADSWEHLVGSCTAYASQRREYLYPLWEAYRSAARTANAANGGVNHLPPASAVGEAKLYALAVGSGADGLLASVWLRGRAPEEDADELSSEGASSGSDASSVVSDASHPSSLGFAGTGELVDNAAAGFVLAAKFFGSVLPAHRRCISALFGSAGHKQAAAAGAGGIAAGAAAAAPGVPDGAYAVDAVGPLAAEAEG